MKTISCKDLDVYFLLIILTLKVFLMSSEPSEVALKSFLVGSNRIIFLLISGDKKKNMKYFLNNILHFLF